MREMAAMAVTNRVVRSMRDIASSPGRVFSLRSR
jgi:hypothetical protein